jgi:D-3-phosphoglycerate dehydrogenase / 2-oxoglutarate reductase
VVDPYVQAVDGARMATLDEALASADAVSVHTPLTPDTRGLVNDFSGVRDGLVVVNTARAGILDEAALEAAVRDGRVAGVGLDVSADESRWRRLIIDGYANVVLTGHTGGRGSQAQATLRRTCADQVVDYLSGRVPAHVVAPTGPAGAVT